MNNCAKDGDKVVLPSNTKRTGPELKVRAGFKALSLFLATSSQQLHVAKMTGRSCISPSFIAVYKDVPFFCTSSYQALG